MRPLKLRVEGFACYKDAVEIDFEPLELFAIWGPTGSGKTSLLDAMMFALFGKVPRLVERQTSQSALISLGKPRLSTMLEFRVGNRRFRITRSLSRKKKSVDVNFEEVVGDKDVPITSRVAEAEAEIQCLLGLNYNAFTQAVVLPQGQFAQFLRSKPAERGAILRELLRVGVYEMMRKKAFEQCKGLGTKREGIEERLRQDYSDANEEALSRLGKDEAVLSAEIETLGAACKEAEADYQTLTQRHAWTRELETKSRALDDLRKRETDVRRDEERVRVARRVAAVLGLLDAAGAAADKLAGEKKRVSLEREAYETANCLRERHREAAGRAQKEADQLPALRERIDRLQVVLGWLEPMERADRHFQSLNAELDSVDIDITKMLNSTLPSLESELEEKKQRAAAERTAHERAAEILQEARGRHRGAMIENAAAVVRKGLQEGEPCPVCEQIVKRVPPAGPETSLQEMEKAEGKAEKAEQAARQLRESAQEEVFAATAALGQAKEKCSSVRLKKAELTRERDEACREVEEYRGRIREVTSAKDPAKERADLVNRRDTLEKALRESQKSFETADRDVRERESRLGEMERSLETLGKEAEATRNKADAAVADLGFVDQQAARAAAMTSEQMEISEGRIREWREQVSALTGRMEELESQLRVAGAQGRIQERVSEEALVREKSRIENLRTKLREDGKRLGALQQQVKTLANRLKRADELREELRNVEDEQNIFRTLSADLAADEFQRYLLDEAFRDLVDGASLRLKELTSGRYELQSEEMSFFVIDHDNAGEQRPADTLSGGETFLASLALALELSQQVQKAAGAVQLDSIFIDEGFGTLDAETLETVAEAIERLPAHGRMVGIITHLRELTERLPARIEVAKTGKVVVVV